jgi:hypothetical protein
VNDNDTRSSVRFSKYGTYLNLSNDKCVIFPKGKDTWEGFVPPCEFKNADIVCSALNSIAIIKGKSNIGGYSVYCGVTADDDFYDCVAVTPMRLATEEEKQKLLQVIKNNGYKWNAETKTLEKIIKPKFKVGDRISPIWNKIVWFFLFWR